jgi:hypothetical protein
VDEWKGRLKPWESFSEMPKGSAAARGQSPRTKRLWASRKKAPQVIAHLMRTAAPVQRSGRWSAWSLEERSEGYIVVDNRIDRGKLHRAGKYGCWMAKQRKFKRATVYETYPDEGTYTSRCRLCWQELKAELSSSDSEDEVAECEGKEEAEPVVSSRLSESSDHLGFGGSTGPEHWGLGDLRNVQFDVWHE